MIGHWLLTLTPEQEDRVLLRPFERLLMSCGAAPDVEDRGCRCLLLTATDGAAMFGRCWNPHDDWRAAPGYRYEELAQRFGEPRINAAIRNRILANQARRALAPRREVVRVPCVGARGGRRSP